jgi:hypothetical protein
LAKISHFPFASSRGTVFVFVLGAFVSLAGPAFMFSSSFATGGCAENAHSRVCVGELEGVAMAPIPQHRLRVKLRQVVRGNSHAAKSVKSPLNPQGKLGGNDGNKPPLKPDYQVRPSPDYRVAVAQDYPALPPALPAVAHSACECRRPRRWECLLCSSRNCFAAASISMQQFHQPRFIRKTFCQRLIERCQTSFKGIIPAQ